MQVFTPRKKVNSVEEAHEIRIDIENPEGGNISWCLQLFESQIVGLLIRTFKDIFPLL